jgi:hypothetical protein
MRSAALIWNTGTAFAYSVALGTGAEDQTAAMCVHCDTNGAVAFSTDCFWLCPAFGVGKKTH